MNENTVSPGLAYGGWANVASIVPEPSASVPVYELLKSTWKNVLPPHVILLMLLMYVLEGNVKPLLPPVISVPIVADVAFTLDVVR